MRKEKAPFAALGFLTVLGLFSLVHQRGVLDRAAKEVDIALSGDSLGHIVGTVSKDLGRTGLAGETVTLSGSGWTCTAVTGENGFFAVGTPLNAKGRITAAVRVQRASIDASDIPLRLTARPKN